jgi:hypothetical protein
MPNFESLNHCGTGRLSSDSQVGWYCADEFLFINTRHSKKTERTIDLIIANDLCV